MKFEFEPNKNLHNLQSRQLPFTCVANFNFDTALVAQDIRKDYPEQRFVALGFLDDRLHVLCFTPIDGGLRVISFR